jgi:hypothetical protein
MNAPRVIAPMKFGVILMVLFFILLVIPVTAEEENNEGVRLVLNPGWNCLAVPKFLVPGENTYAIFSAVDMAHHSILSFNNERRYWERVDPLAFILPLDAFWVYSNGTSVIPLRYLEEHATTTIDKPLVSGWNLLGYPDTYPLSANETFSGLGDRWIEVIQFDSDAQRYNTPILHGGGIGFEDSQPLVPFQGFWIFMNSNGTISVTRP